MISNEFLFQDFTVPRPDRKKKASRLNSGRGKPRPLSDYGNG